MADSKIDEHFIEYNYNLCKRAEYEGDIFKLCGGCQQWGQNPPLKNGICEICGRSEKEILARHGVINPFHPLVDDIAEGRLTEERLLKAIKKL